MSEEYKWVRMMQRHGSPVNGAILNVGAVVRMPDHVAHGWVASGIAIETNDPHAKSEQPAVEETPAKEPEAEKPIEKPAKTKKGK